MLCVIRCKKEINRFVEIFVWSYVDYIICLVTVVYENPNEFQLNILSEKKPLLSMLRKLQHEIN